MRRHPPRGRETARTAGPFRGFTLVELLVAVALTMFLLALFAGLLQFATAGVRDAKGINAVDQRLRNAVATIKADLAQIYIARDGNRLSPARLFTAPDQIPNEGFLSIEENSRALSVGVDGFGNPVEIDWDDVLSFTAFRNGATKSDIFTGRAANTGNQYIVDAANPNPSKRYDLGTFLDSVWHAPAGRQDAPNNGLVTSRFAEICYFARHAGNPPTLEEIGADPHVFANAAQVQTIPAVARTMNLYRRQLLVLDDPQLNRSQQIANGLGPVLIPAAPTGGSIYNFCDVSVSRELAVLGGTLQLATQGGQNALHFNTLADLTRREFRYGMQPVFSAFPTPFTAAPYPLASMPSTNTLRAQPISHVDLTGGGSFGAGGVQPSVHEYAAIVAPPRTGRSETWVGRPTFSESAHANYPVWLPGTPPNMTLDSAGRLANYVSTAAQGGDEDILLRGVLSFNVAVLESIAGYPGEAPNGSADAAAPQGAAPYSQTQDHDVTNAVYGGAGKVANPGLRFNNTYQRRQAFVDLGYGADQFDATTPAGGDIQVPSSNKVNTLDVSNYLFQLPPGLTAALQLNDAAFGFAWPPTTPYALGGNLPRGAYGPANAPFGVPLLVTTGSNPDFARGADGGAAVNDDLAAGWDTLLSGRPGILGPDSFAGLRGSGATDLDVNSDDNPFVGIPFKLSGQVGGNANAAGGGLFHPFNLGNLNPRNTYDSWSAAGPLVSGYTGAAVLPAYEASPVVVVPNAGTNTYVPNPNFRPVPYPRPLKGIQIKLRVLEPRTGIVREATIRHYFPKDPQ